MLKCVMHDSNSKMPVGVPTRAFNGPAAQQIGILATSMHKQAKATMHTALMTLTAITRMYT
jgi:hypothetical protein